MVGPHGALPPLQTSPPSSSQHLLGSTQMLVHLHIYPVRLHFGPALGQALAGHWTQTLLSRGHVQLYMGVLK